MRLGHVVGKHKLDVLSRRRVWVVGGALAVVLSVAPRVLHYGHIGLLWIDLESRSPILDRHLEAWHRGCDVHVGEPVETPAASDCARALHEMVVYAEMKGFSSYVEVLTALVKQTGWSRE